MAKVETEAPEFRPVVITLESQFEVDVVAEIFNSIVHHEYGVLEAREALVVTLCNELKAKKSEVTPINFSGFLTIIPEHIE